MKTPAKKQYYANELENSRGNPQKTWQLLRTLLRGKSDCSKQDSHAFVNKKFPTFSLPKFAQNKLSSSHLKYRKLQLF